MHWFWRAAIAILVGKGLTLTYGVLILGPLMVPRINDGSLSPTAFAIMGHALGAMSITAAVATYGILTRRYYRLNQHDNETRCRKCDYILRGITEPRCPECGEKI